MDTLAKVFSFKFCEILKNSFFAEHLRKTASKRRNFYQLSCGAVLSLLHSFANLYIQSEYGKMREKCGPQ